MGSSCGKNKNATPSGGGGGTKRNRSAIKQDIMMKVKYREIGGQYTGRGIKKTPCYEIFLTDKDELEAKRLEFWSTRVDGASQIWSCIKSVIEEPDVDTGEEILRAAEIILPHGSLVMSFDQIGYRYDVPIYCLNEPSSYLGHEDENRVSENSLHDNEEWSLKLRVPQLQKDYDFTVENTTLVSELKGIFLETARLENVTIETTRILFGGRVLKNNHSLIHAKLTDGMTAQAWFSKVDVETNKKESRPE